MDLLLELMQLNERIYSKGSELVISVQHSKETSTDEAISTFMRRNPFHTHLPQDKNAEVYSLLNYVSSDETSKLLSSLKGKGPYKVNERQYETFMEDVIKHAVHVLLHVRPDTIIVPKSNSLLHDFGQRLKHAYPKAKYIQEGFIKKTLDANNVEPLLNKHHPDWEKFETEHPKDVANLRKALSRQIKTTGQLELKKLYKPYLKFVRNFVELQNAYDHLENFIGKKVVILDDILSSGVTMAEMIFQLRELEPKHVTGLTIFKRTNKAHE